MNWTAVGDDQRPTEGDSRLQVRGSNSSERLMHEPRDLEHESLTDWQPVQLQ